MKIQAALTAILLALSPPAFSASNTIYSQTLEPNPDTGDELIIDKAGDGATRKITVGSIISGQTAVSAAGLDSLAVIDASDSALRKITIQSIAEAGLIYTLGSGTAIGTLTLSDGSIVDSDGTISFDNENLVTTGTLGAGVATLATGSEIGTLTLSDGSITDSSGTISFGDENLSTTGVFDGRDVSADGAKLDLIEASATADQTDEEIEDIAGGLVGGGTGTHTGIAVTYQDSTNDVDFVVDHDAATNFVANEHVDHSGVTLTAGDGITGTGDISASRTFDIGAGTGVTVNADDVAIGQDVATTANVSFNAVSISDTASARRFLSPEITTTLPMTDGVVTGIYPATEKGVPDAWRFNKAASWYNEARTTGTYLGEFSNVTAGAGAAGAAIGDYYYDTTSETYQELTNIGTPASTETFRAGSAEFPATIAIVITGSTADRVVIIDASDGSMWSVATIWASATYLFADSSAAGVDALDFKNGTLAYAADATGAGYFDFKNDTGRRYRIATAYSFQGEWTGGWAGRNNGGVYVPTGSIGHILSNVVIAVAIGNASEHYGYDEWGVPKQYIAVGCSSTNGVSVIHPNGKVYDITGQPNAVVLVQFNSHGELLATGANHSSAEWYEVPFRDGAASTTRIRRALDIGNASTDSSTFPRLLNGFSKQEGLTSIEDKVLSIDSSKNTLTVIDEDVFGTGDNDGRDSPATYVGYDSALAEHFHSPLVDRLVTAAIGMETGTTDLLQENVFSASVSAPGSGWTKGTGWSTSGGVATCDGVGTGYIWATGTDLDTGVSHTIKLVVTRADAGTLEVYSSDEGSTVLLEITAIGTYEIERPESESATLYLRSKNGDPFDGDFDEAYAYPYTKDRSQLNANHAKINGTITRAAYDGGDVVMHSGAVAAGGGGTNIGAYWEIGYDAFATDGVIYNSWLVITPGTIQDIISNRGLDGGNPATTKTDATNAGTAIFTNDSKLYAKDSTGVDTVNTSISTALSAGLHHIIIVLSSTDIYVYVDGELNQVTASKVLTAPTDAITYIHPSNVALPRVGGIDRKATADYYKWLYDKERRLFYGKSTLQYTGDVVDIAVDEARKTYTVLQTDGYTTFDQDNIVVASGAVSDTGVSMSVHDGDMSILDGANLTLTVAEKRIPDYPAQIVKEKRVFEYDSLLEADPRIFGTSFTTPPNTSGDTVGGSTLDWDGAEGASNPRLVGAMVDLFNDEAGSYLTGFTVANRTAGTFTLAPSGASGTARSADGTYSETIVYDPAASIAQNLVFETASSSFDGQVSDYRLRKVGVPYWLPKGWRILSVSEDGVKARPDTPDLIRDGAIVRNGDGQYGWLSTVDTWDELSIEAVEVH